MRSNLALPNTAAERECNRLSPQMALFAIRNRCPRESPVDVRSEHLFDARCAMKCEFCWDEDRGEPLTKEHLVSQPIADAFHIDRVGGQVARFDRGELGDGNLDSVTWCSLAELSVRLACARCNNGWMNDLEHEMAAVARWFRAGDRALGKAQLRAVGRWLLKTYAVMAVLDGATRRFVDADGAVGSHVIPDPTRARLLRAGDDGALHSIVIGAGKASDPDFAYGFGNPTIRSTAQHPPSVRSAGVAAMNLGSLQVWAVVPWIRSGRVQLPPGLTVLNSRTRANQLRSVPRVPETDRVVVDFGSLDAEELSRAMLEHAASLEVASEAVDS